jgi:hypothetical protein
MGVAVAHALAFIDSDIGVHGFHAGQQSCVTVAVTFVKGVEYGKGR